MGAVTVQVCTPLSGPVINAWFQKELLLSMGTTNHHTVTQLLHALAVAAHQAAEAEEGELPTTASPSKEESEEEKAARKADAVRAADELKARRRMLGNIQFIGHLYRFKMLTENIMHSCIRRLLEDDKNPKPEDIECLCKLLTTIGGQLENPEVNTKKGDPKQVSLVHSALVSMHRMGS